MQQGNGTPDRQFKVLHANGNGSAAGQGASGKLGMIWRDIPSSIVVFLVALPLCMGVAIASGAPVAAGLVTGIVGGLVVGFLAGSPLQVSGPAAGLTVIVYGMIQEHGLAALGLIVLVAGAIQLVAGLLKIGQWFRAVSPAVIKGMLAGIGVLIFGSQFHVMVDDKPRDNGLQNLAAIPESIRKGLTTPELGDRDQRAFRTTKLRQLGQLHREQADIESDIAEVLGSLTAADQPTGSYAAALAPMVERQEQVVAELEEIIAALERGLKDGPDLKSENLHAAAVQAHELSRAALNDLRRTSESGTVERVEQRVAEGEIRLEPAVQLSQAEATASLGGVLEGLKNHGWAAKVGILTILLIIGWQAFAPKKLKVIPAPLLAIVAATSLAAMFMLPVIYINVPANLMDDLHPPTWNIFQSISLSALLTAALIIAVIASAETLLCCTAVDQMHQGPRTNYDKELFAQGVGNMTCGLLGGLPMTGVIVRSAANVQAGAKTRASAILHGLWLLLFVVFLAGMLQLIPTAALAAILVYTGYKLVNIKSIRELWHYGTGEVIIYFATVITIVAVDLLAGVLLGVALSGVKLLYTFSHLKTRIEMGDSLDKAVLRMEGAATFIRLPKLAAELERVPRGVELHVDLQNLDYIDHACLDLLMNWAKQHQATGGRLVVDWDSLHATFKRGEAARRTVGGAVAEGNGDAAAVGDARASS